MTKLKVPINASLETHMLAGCKIIAHSSADYEHITHILLECPKGYLFDEERKRFTQFIIEETLPDSWYDAIMLFAGRIHAKKSFSETVSNDRYSNRKKMEQLRSKILEPS